MSQYDVTTKKNLCRVELTQNFLRETSTNLTSTNKYIILH